MQCRRLFGSKGALCLNFTVWLPEHVFRGSVPAIMHVPAAAAAAGTAYTGKWLFDYNRANFQYDVPQRFGRFMTSRGMLNAQVGQYRQDVHGIAELTASKMDTVQAMMTLVLCVCAALSDAGRIGMHGCAPPQWLCGLYSGHNS